MGLKMKTRKKCLIIAICFWGLLLGTGCVCLPDKESRQNAEEQNIEAETGNVDGGNRELEPLDETLQDSKNSGVEAIGEASEEGSWQTYDYWTEWTGSNVKEDLPYADEETFAVIKEAYGKVEFAGVFKKGDTDVYGDYINIFRKLLNNEMPFYNPKTGEEICLGDFEGLKLYDESTKRYTKYDALQYKYIFFDMDEDGSPELGIRNLDNHNAVYIFGYDAEERRCLLWYEMSTGAYVLFGSRKVAIDGDGKYLTFYQLNEDGEMECKTFGTSNWISREISLHTVALPQYADEEQEILVTDEMREQGIFERSKGRWFFRVTEAQYEELMEPYWKAYDSAEREIKKVTYTYEELFGSIEP